MDGFEVLRAPIDHGEKGVNAASSQGTLPSGWHPRQIWVGGGPFSRWLYRWQHGVASIRCRQVPTTTRRAPCCRSPLKTRPAPSMGFDSFSLHSPRLARTWLESVNNKPLASDSCRPRRLGHPSEPGLCGTDGSTERRFGDAWQGSRADSERRTSGRWSQPTRD